MRSLFVLAIACLLSACAQQSQIQLYPGSPLSDEQVLTVVVPNELEVQSINGQQIPSANWSFGNADKRLELQPGVYRINAFYKNGFDIDGGISHEVVRGRTATFIVDGQPGELWQLDFDRPENLQQAKAFEAAFSAWTVNTRTGERHAAEAGQRNNSVINNLIGGTADPVAEQTSVAPLGAAPASARAIQPAPAQGVVRPMPGAMANETLPHNDATLSTLQQMWQLLGDDSRAAFLKWAQQ
ncbi:hypothetical protein SAMN05216198_1274 [Halopseudomonas litoralis]|uniref:DUF2057 domain-containing protein n=1 Tax=Halopseudomonas litoralis TaxID=797277 RepID=A0A1H1PTK1_9GAMM|nr:DUF2057 family protein [Halopseudomonas litoralis]SDS14337.1 hypothetical protein SAMN05216198_1274 [Halopseudomonas litoralis]